MSELQVTRHVSLDRGGWTSVPNSLLRSPKLSMEARWLWSYFNSHSDNFKPSFATIQAAAGCGRDRLYKILNELIEAGLLHREQEEQVGGKFGVTTYSLMFPQVIPLTENPEADPASRTEIPYTEAPLTDPPYTADPTHKKNNSKKTNEKKTNEKNTPAAPAALFELDDPPSFENFWSAYPNKKSKIAAQRAWNAALKRGVPPERIVKAAGEYARAVQGREQRYIKHPSSWLNGGSYDDVVEPTTSSKNVNAVWDDEASYQQPGTIVHNVDPWAEAL